MSKEIKKTSKEWIKEVGYEVLDPDGWDRTNFDYSWNKEEITMEDVKDFWNKYWHKPKKVMANEFGHNETNKELALKFAKAYHQHKLKLLGISVVVEQSEQLIAKEQDAFDKGYTKGWTEGFNSGKVNGD